MDERKLNIMVIDDDVVVRFINKTIINSFTEVHFSYREAVNGQNAIQILQEMTSTGEEFPDVILLDLNMPVLDGFGFIQKFNETYVHKKTEIVIVTSSENQMDKERGHQLGVHKIVSKPMTREKLTDAISNCLN